MLSAAQWDWKRIEKSKYRNAAEIIELALCSGAELDASEYHSSVQTIFIHCVFVLFIPRAYCPSVNGRMHVHIRLNMRKSQINSIYYDY